MRKSIDVIVNGRYGDISYGSPKHKADIICTAHNFDGETAGYKRSTDYDGL